MIGIDNSDWHNRFCKQCFVVPFWYNETLLQAMSLYIQSPLPCKSLLDTAQTRCSASCRCRLRVFQNALSALRRSAQPSRAVMFTGIGIVSQQAEHARQIFNAVRVLAFVRTKALLADATWLNRFISSSLEFFPESSGLPGATAPNSARLLSTSMRLRLPSG